MAKPKKTRQVTVQEVNRWLSTNQGKQALATALSKSTKRSVKFNEAIRVNEKVLHEPITL